MDSNCATEFLLMKGINMDRLDALTEARVITNFIADWQETQKKLDQAKTKNEIVIAISSLKNSLKNKSPYFFQNDVEMYLKGYVLNKYISDKEAKELA